MDVMMRKMCKACHVLLVRLSAIGNLCGFGKRRLGKRVPSTNFAPPRVLVSWQAPIEATATVVFNL